MNNCYSVVRLVIILTVTAGVLGACGIFTDDETRVARAKEHMASGDYRTAVIELKKVLQNNANNKDARLLLGKASYAIGDMGAAEKELRRAQKLGARPEDVLIPLGKTLLLLGAYQPLLNEINPDVVDDTEARSQILALRGNAHLRLGSLVEAQQSFDRALELQEAFPGGLIGLAQIAQTRGDSSTAEAYITKATSENPDHVAVWIAKGQFEFSRKAYGQAEDAFAYAIELPQATAIEAFAARSGLIEAQLVQGKAEDILSNVETLLKIAPKHPQANYLRARVAYSAKDYDTTAEYLQKVLGVIPDHRPSQLLLGTVNYEQGNFDQAEMYISSLVAADPSSLAARRLLAEIRLQLGHPEDALATLTPALLQDPDDPQLLAMISKAAFQAGDVDAGVAHLEEGLRADPDNRALQMQLAAGYLTVGEIELAIETLEQLPETKEGPYRRELLLISAYLRKQNTKSALAEAQKLLASRSDDAGVHYVVGVIRMVTGQATEARKHFEKALELKPDHTTALMNLGRLDYQAGRHGDARARFERALQTSPNNVSAMTALAHLSAARGADLEALKWMQRARSADPRAIAPMLMLVQYHLAKRNFERAQQLAGEAVDIAPKQPLALNALGVAQLAAGNHHEAAGSFRQAIEALPNSADYHYNLARAQLALNNFGEAKQSLSRALELLPDHAAATSTLAMIEMREGSSKQALARARKLQKSQPKSLTGYAIEGDLHMMQQKFANAVRAYEAALKRAERLPDRSTATARLFIARKRANIPNPARVLEKWLAEHPDDNQIRLLLAKDYQQRNKNEAAIAQYQRIVKDVPDQPAALNNLAWLYHVSQDPRAVQTAERAHRIRPQDGRITDTLGWLLVQAGQLERGLTLLRQAAAQAPQVPAIRYHLAIALVKNGAKDEARKMLTELLDSSAAFKERAEAQKMLEGL